MSQAFVEAIQKNVILFDGGMGTEIQQLSPKPEDFPDYKEGFNDGLIITRPEWVKQIHRNYLRAGADCIETNTFGSNRYKLEEYGYENKTVQFNKKAAELAREVCFEFIDKARYVIGSMGPSGFLPSSNDPDLGTKGPDEIKDAFLPQAIGLISGGVDALLIETSQDILEVKAVIEACHEAIESTRKRVAIIANVTLDQYGKMLLGTSVQAAYTTVSDMEIDAFGLNCSTGPIEMTPSIRWLSEQDELPIVVMPNAGMPQNEGGKAIYKMSPIEMAEALGDFIKRFNRVRVIGGCCGTNPQHICELRKMLDRHRRLISDSSVKF